MRACPARIAALTSAAGLIAASVVALGLPPAAGAAPRGPASSAWSGDGGDTPSVAVDPKSITAAGPDLSVAVSSPVPLTAATVSLTSTGAVAVDHGARPVSVVAGRPTRVSIGAAAPGGAGTITATLRGTTESGARTMVRSTTYVDTVDGTPVASISGQDLKILKIDLRHEKGLISAATARAQREKVLGATNSIQTVTPSHVCATVCVSGLAKWTDHVGGTHVIPDAPVKIYAIVPGPPQDELLATTSTDDHGHYAAAVSPAGQDIYVRILAAGPGFAISSSTTGQQYIGSDPVTAPADGTSVVVDFTTSNDETMDNNTAFSVQNALVVGNRFVVAMNGSRYRAVNVDFPNLAGGSYFQASDNTLFLDAGDRWDWDPVLHEFGHAVMHRLGIEANPGGNHSPGDNLSDLRHSKKIGTRLAWGEAWPTYFSLSAQQFEHAAALHVPNIGDSLYQDTEDAHLTINPERGSTLGEDNEVTGIAILWDLYDAHSDGRDQVSLGARRVWNHLKGSGATTLSAAYRVFAPGGTADNDPTNCVFSQYNVSPLIAGRQVRHAGLHVSSPDLSWTRGNGGTHRNDRFVVEYRRRNGQLLYRSPALTRKSFTAPAAEWKAVKRHSHGAVAITVVGTQTDIPVTGPYRSCAQTWQLGG